MKDEGYEATIPAVLSALDDAQSADLLFWASRYNLFVLWSADRQHPWDALPGAGRHVTLEVGKLRDTDGQVVLLLDGRPITDYTFQNAVLKTTAPIEWATPDGGVALVNLEVQFSAFFGYGVKEAAGAYLGLQCHGVLWPAAGSDKPAFWPVSPPLVSGKVNIAGRSAAVSPGAADSLAAFVGAYATHVLPTEPGAPAAAGSELAITVNPQGRPVVTVGAAVVTAWAFDANNVLAWDDEAGCSAWLQFMVLPSGPVFMGSLRAGDGGAGAMNVFGELRSQPSRLTPDATMDPAIGQMVAAGLSSAATLLTGQLLRSAARCWALLKAGNTADDIMARHDGLLHAMQCDFGTLARLHAVGAAAETAFAGGADVKDMSPAATADALAGEGEAGESAQAAKVAAEAAASAAAETEDAGSDGNAMEATSKAAVSAWRASQAAAAAAAAEAACLEASRHARLAHTITALNAAMAAAQSYNMARACAADASRAEARAAAAALRAVEQGIALYAERRDYLKLKEIAEASDVAGKALAAAKQAVEGWAAGSATGRTMALEAAKTCADAAQLCHKFMRSVHKN